MVSAKNSGLPGGQNRFRPGPGRNHLCRSPLDPACVLSYPTAPSPDLERPGGSDCAALRFNALVTTAQSGARSSLLIRAQAPASNTSRILAGSALPVTQSVGMFVPIAQIKARASVPLKVGSLLSVMMMSQESCSRARCSSAPLSTLLARGVKPHRLSCRTINSQSFWLSSIMSTRNGWSIPPVAGFCPESMDGSVGALEEPSGEPGSAGSLVRLDSGGGPP